LDARRSSIKAGCRKEQSKEFLRYEKVKIGSASVKK